MKEPREDDERLSALLEGRVEGRQREDLLAHLSAADDDYEVFTDTAAVLRALEEEDARTRRGAVPPSMRGARWPTVRTAAAVAGAVVLLLALGWAMRGRGTSPAGDPLQLAMRLDTAVDWSPWTPRGTVRGSDAGAARAARAIRAGVRLVDLSLAVRSRDTARTRELASVLVSRFDPGASDRTPLRQILARPDAPTDSLNALVGQATERLMVQLGRKSLELGAWAEAARLAAGARNADFFTDGASDGMLRRARDLARDDEDAAAVQRVRMALPVNGIADWNALEASLGTMLSTLTR